MTFRRKMAVVTIVLLVYALAPWNPYNYYRLLRWVVAAMFAGFIASAWYRHARVALGFSLVVAVVYSPIGGLSFSRATWSVINVATIFVIVSVERMLSGYDSRTALARTSAGSGS